MQRRCTPRVTGYGEPVTIASAETIGKDQSPGSDHPDHQLVTRYGKNNYVTTLPPLGAVEGAKVTVATLG